MKKNYLLAVLIGCTVGLLQAQQSINVEALAHQLDSIFMKDIPANAPGAAVGIVQNGKIVYKKYAGYANLKKEQLINESSRFNIASNGKQFTALAIVLLEEQGKLSLDDDIRKYLPDLYPKIEEKITISHLLTHRSGIRDVYDLWSLKGITWWKQTFSNEDVLEILSEQRELNFKPGDAYLYSNSNYILLAEVVSKVSDKSFIAFTDDMFAKLNMQSTSFVSNYKSIPGPVANPYFNFDGWVDYKWTCNIHGDGNLFSTLEDQLEWEKIIQTKNSDYLPAELILKSQNLINENETYGYGLEFSKYKGIPYRFHEGSTGACKATTVRFIENNLSIVTLTNSGKITPDRQTRMMADVLLDIKADDSNIQQEPEDIGSFISIADIIGVYHNNSSFYFRFEKRGDDLYLIRNGRNDTKLVREADNIFHQWNDPAFKQEFIINENNEMEVTAYYTTHQPYTLTRLNAYWIDFDYTSLNGAYENEETNASFQLTYESEKEYSIKFNKRNIKGLLITPNKLVANGYIVDVIKLGADEVVFLVTGDRIQKVKFVKKG